MKKLKRIISELYYFTIKQARAALFAAAFLFLLAVSKYVAIPGLYRYDFLFIAAVCIQALLLLCKFETKDEAKTIFLFHIIGLCLELYKTNPAIGSWTYPEPGVLKIGNVPLYSGFMYAAVGSYIVSAWKVLKLHIEHHPSYKASIAVCVLIYLNFFTNHFFYDIRVFLFIAICFLYYRTTVYFTPRQTEYHMPLLVGFALIGFFVWIAENISTFYGAWLYPNQLRVWEAVSLHKITSWFLLVIICFIVVASLKHFKETRNA